MLLELILLFTGSIIAFWISAICGGGASLILIPLLNIFIPASQVPFALTLGTFSSSVSRISMFKKHINWKIFAWFVPFSIPAVLTGAYLVKYINPNYLQVIVGLFLISNLPQLFNSSKKDQETKRKYPNYLLAFIGFLAGFISGITGAIGLLFNRFYLRFGLKKEEIVATRAANEVCLHFIKLFIYVYLGLFSKSAMYLGIIIASATIVSAYSIKYILPLISDHLFKKIGFIAMVLSGFSLLWTTSNKIIEQDNFKIESYHDGAKNYSTVTWKSSKITFEYALNYRLEVEKTITAAELPDQIFIKYSNIIDQYDEIILEKVYSIGNKPSYEFNCYKENKLHKIKI